MLSIGSGAGVRVKMDRDEWRDKYENEQREADRYRNERNESNNNVDKLEGELEGRVQSVVCYVTFITLELREANGKLDTEVKRLGAILNKSVKKSERLENEKKGMLEMAAAMKSCEGPEAKKTKLSGGR